MSGLSGGMSERSSCGFETMSVVVRQSWRIERGSPASGWGVRQLDLKVTLMEEDGLVK